MTRETYLEMTYRHGKPLAGYLHLPGKDARRVARSKKVADGLVVDYAADGCAIGIEIVSLSIVSFEMINEVLSDLHCRAVSKEELAPLMTA